MISTEVTNAAEQSGMKIMKGTQVHVWAAMHRRSAHTLCTSHLTTSGKNVCLAESWYSCCAQCAPDVMCWCCWQNNDNTRFAESWCSMLWYTTRSIWFKVVIIVYSYTGEQGHEGVVGPADTGDELRHDQWRRLSHLGDRTSAQRRDWAWQSGERNVYNLHGCNRAHAPVWVNPTRILYECMNLTCTST